MIETTQLTKRYARVTALESVDLSVDRGTVFGVLGPTGAGKSTLCSLIAGRDSPTEGTVSVAGCDPTEDPESARARIGYAGDDLPLDDARTGRALVREALVARESARDSDDASDSDSDSDDTRGPAAVLDRLGVDRARADRPVESYPVGTARRVHLAVALAGHPDVIVLDDPLAGLDQEGRLRLRSILRAEAQRGTTILLAARRLASLPRICDRLDVLAAGSLHRPAAAGGVPDGANAVLPSRETPSQPRVTPARPSGDQLVALRVDQRPDANVAAIPGVVSVWHEAETLYALVSSPAATPTVVLEVAHADVAIHGATVTELDPVSLQDPSPPAAAAGEVDR